MTASDQLWKKCGRISVVVTQLHNSANFGIGTQAAIGRAKQGLVLYARPMTYDGVAKTLHWAVACLLVLQFPLAWTMPRIAPGRPPEVLVRFHLSIGLSILAVMLLRLVWRATHRPPPLPGDVPKWQRRMSGLVHAALYAVLLAAPIAGWAWASARGWPIALFGAIAVPRLVAAGSSLGPAAAAAHRVLGWTILALVGLHVLAALYHLAVRRDNVVARMLPR